MTASPPLPRFSDARVTLRWLAFLAPVVVVSSAIVWFLPRPEPALAASLGGAAALLGAAGLGLWYAEPELRVAR